MYDSELERLSDEIIDYASETEDYSYYDLYAYAYTDKNEWLPVFQNRQLRTFLSVALKSANHSRKGKNTPNYAEAMERYLAAEEAYRKKHEVTRGEEIYSAEVFNEVTE